MNGPPDTTDDDDELERSLERGLQRPPLPPEALERIRTHVLAEFRRQKRSSVMRRRRLWAVAATIGTLAIGTFLFSTYYLRNVVVARQESGQALHPLEHWDVREATVARLTAGGTVRISEGTEVSGALNSRGLVLSTGRVYFDFPPGTGPFVVHTSLGTVEHVGTQFEVLQSAQSVRVRVREGSVVLRGDQRVVAIDSGNEVLVERDGVIRRGEVPTYGAEWTWVEDLAPPYDIENRRLSDFLSWVGRETGRQITFVDPHAREIADRTTLHGSVKGLRPLEALDQVLGTTTLRFDIRGGEIRIASRN